MGTEFIFFLKDIEDLVREGKKTLEVGEGSRISAAALDLIREQGMEKVLARADVLVLPTLCFQVASRVAHLLADDPDSRLVFSALVQGKRVLAAQDGFMVYETLANPALKAEIGGVLKKLEGFGVVFCPTRELAETFGRITGDLVPEQGTVR